MSNILCFWLVKNPAELAGGPNLYMRWPGQPSLFCFVLSANRLPQSHSLALCSNISPAMN